MVGWGLMVRAQRNYLRTVEERARDLEAGRDLLAANVRDQERRRIAREMHDALAHRLSLLSVHAGALELRPDLSAEQIRTMAGVIRDTSHLALEDLQDVIGLLGDTASHNASLLTPHPGLDDLHREPLCWTPLSPLLNYRIRHFDRFEGQTRERVQGWRSPTIKR